MSRLFLDLDGVMADFDDHFEALWDYTPAAYCEKFGDDAMWQLIHSHGNFFRELPPMPGALLHYRDILQEYRPIILTACPRSNYDAVAQQKIAWVREHLGDDVLVIPTFGGSTKRLFVTQPGDILIDDFERNTKAWEAAGGLAIHHTGDWEATLDKLVWAA